MKIKTSELIDAGLDWAVSLITNPEWENEDRWWNTLGYVDIGDPDDEPYKPSENWAQGGPIIEREVIALVHHKWECWSAQAQDGTDLDTPLYIEDGPTPLIAAMRCYVASKLGEVVDIPQELFIE